SRNEEHLGHDDVDSVLFQHLLGTLEHEQVRSLSIYLQEIDMSNSMLRAKPIQSASFDLDGGLGLSVYLKGRLKKRGIARDPALHEINLAVPIRGRNRKDTNARVGAVSCLEN